MFSFLKKKLGSPHKPSNAKPVIATPVGSPNVLLSSGRKRKTTTVDTTTFFNQFEQLKRFQGKYNSVCAESSNVENEKEKPAPVAAEVLPMRLLMFVVILSAVTASIIAFGYSTFVLENRLVQAQYAMNVNYQQSVRAVGEGALEDKLTQLTTSTAVVTSDVHNISEYIQSAVTPFEVTNHTIESQSIPVSVRVLFVPVTTSEQTAAAQSKPSLHSTQLQLIVQPTQLTEKSKKLKQHEHINNVMSKEVNFTDNNTVKKRVPNVSKLWSFVQSTAAIVKETLVKDFKEAVQQENNNV